MSSASSTAHSFNKVSAFCAAWIHLTQRQILNQPKNASKSRSGDIEDYTKKFEVSDNLKWSLSSDTAAENQPPLGRTAAATPQATTAVGASGQR